MSRVWNRITSRAYDAASPSGLFSRYVFGDQQRLIVMVDHVLQEPDLDRPELGLRRCWRLRASWPSAATPMISSDHAEPDQAPVEDAAQRLVGHDLLHRVLLVGGLIGRVPSGRRFLGGDPVITATLPAGACATSAVEARPRCDDSEVEGDGSAQRGEIVWEPPPAAVRGEPDGRSSVGSVPSGRASADLSTFPDLLDLVDRRPRRVLGLPRGLGGRALARRTAPARSPIVRCQGRDGFPAERSTTPSTRSCRRSAAPAIVSLSQTRQRSELSYDELHIAVQRCAAGLRRLGVERGDRVVGLLPNITETIVVFLATASIGAIWSSCAPEFGTSAILDRWRQLEPKVLLTVDGYRYGAREVACDDKVGRPHRRPAVDPPCGHRAVPVRRTDLDPARLGHRAGTNCATQSGLDEPLVFAPVPFDHPLYVLFSSGTTGLPKAIVHSHGGIVVEHLKALRLHHDIGPHDVFMWFTTTGWMMWNYLVSGLLTGASIVLYDGDPGHPDLNTLWSIAETERVTVLGVGAPFLMGCRAEGIEPGRDFALDRLRQVGSTGSPLPADGYRWVRDHVGVDIQLCSISGGTDVCTAFLGGAPVVPVRAGEISTRMLGCDVRAFDAEGAECAAGETGELVICTPMPSMPTGFWGDDSGERFRSAYFEHFAGVWHHGDWISLRRTTAAA